jgi:hypothetical protein
MSAAACWADGGTLASSSSYGSPINFSFIATKTGVDIIIAVYNGLGFSYTVKYEEQ